MESNNTIASNAIQKLKPQFDQAWKGVSFRPEHRAEQAMKENESRLAADIEHLRKIYPDNEELITKFVQGYSSKLSSWLVSESRCISSMITGPSKFPTHKAQKWNDSSMRRYDEFKQWRERFIAAVEKRKRKEEQAAIDPIADVERRIAKKEDSHARMLAVNKLLRKVKSQQTPETDEELVRLGCPKDKLHLLYSSRGFHSWELSSGTKEIRRLKDRLRILTEKKRLRDSGEAPVREFDGGTLSVDYEADRVRLQFDSKPDWQTIRTLRQKAFKWAPSIGMWQRKISPNAIYAAKQIAGLK